MSTFANFGISLSNHVQTSDNGRVRTFLPSTADTGHRLTRPSRTRVLVAKIPPKWKAFQPQPTRFVMEREGITLVTFERHGFVCSSPEY